MSDSYQAIYDAVRSRIANTNMYGAVNDAVASAMPNMHGLLHELAQDIAVRVHEAARDVSQHMDRAIDLVANELKRPSTLYRPKLTLDEDKNIWTATYGDARGHGSTPEEAFGAFDALFKWGRDCGTQNA